MSIAFVAKEAAIIALNFECSVQIIIYPYNNPQVRDLAWSCFSPNLVNITHFDNAHAGLSPCQPEFSVSRQRWLQTLDNDPSALQQYLQEKPSGRLGIYFEKLWHFFLREDPDTELLAHNLPVHQSGRTLGEFDCLYFCRKRQQVVHLELAVKFYLCSTQSAPSDDWQAWIGPNCNDHMNRKLSQMVTRQALLGDTAAGKDTLRALTIANPLKEIALKGYLFRHPTCSDTLPREHNPASPVYNWLRPEDLEPDIYQGKASRFRCLPRSEWLAPAGAADGTDTVHLEQLVETLNDAFDRARRPHLVAHLDAKSQECARFFVVPQCWPWSD